MTRNVMAALIVFLSVSVTQIPISAQDRDPTWLVSTYADLDAGTMTVLGETEYTVELLNGWRCVVTPLSSLARVASCVSGGRTVEVSVDCGPPRSRDRAQVRLWSAEQVVDFIELSCDRNTAYRLLRSSRVLESPLLVATFDAPESAAYNQENCEVARRLFAGQEGVRVEYWCERVTR